MTDYYPSPQKTGKLHDDFRLLFNHVYELRRRLAAVEKPQAQAAPEQEAAGSPSRTKIAGFYVQGRPPQNGQKLTFNSATQQIEWQ